MKDKIKIFEYLETLVKMCRSTNDGASLKIEEKEISGKIEEINYEIEELNTSLTEEVYDESAEMADRNLEIITRKTLNTLKSKLKEKEEELKGLEQRKEEISNELTIFKDNRSSYDEYINVMRERITNCEDNEVIEQYQKEIKVNLNKLKEENEKSSLVNVLEEKINASIETVKKDKEAIEDKITKKEDLLNEIKTNLTTKDSYIDINKQNKINRKIDELTKNKAKLEERLKEIKKDPKYIELKIKSIINDGADTFLSRGYVIDLVNMANKVPYMDMPIDNNLEAELLKATKARDTFANEIDHKSYSLVDMETPNKIRIDYLTKRISNWEQRKEDIRNEIASIDKDETYNYKVQINKLNDIIEDIKSDISEYTTTLEKEDNLVPSVRANYQASLDAKKVDLQNAENILEQFRKEECEDIQRITIELDQEIISLDEKIENANNEIETLKEELLSKKEDLTDIRAMNKDKARLKELASVVIDIKHRRNFPLQPTLIAKQLERLLGIEILNSLDSNTYNTEETSEDNQSGSDLINNLIQKDIDEIEEQYPEVEQTKEEPKEEPTPKRGIRVTGETEITDSSLKEINKEEEPKEEKLGPTLLETMEKMRQEKVEPEEHEEEVVEEPKEETEDDEESTTESSPLDEIEKELDKRIQALKNKAIDNEEEKDDNIKAKEEPTDELEEYIRQLEENK